MADEKTPQQVRAPGFVERYSNHVRFESSFWDLKILFNIYDQSTDPASYPTHTAIHLTWPQAKLMAHYLYMNVLFHEAAAGEAATAIPDSMAPNPMQVPEKLKDDPKALTLVERVERLRVDLFGSSGTPHEEAKD
jgi:hypothetical protein